MTVRELRIGDIVNHEQHGEGVILAIGEWDIEVRFARGRGRAAVERLRLLLPGVQASELLDGALAERSDRTSVVRGSALWLRSSDPSLKGIALEFFSRSDDLGAIKMLAEMMERWPPRTRARVSDLLTGARARNGLTAWPQALESARAAAEVRRIQAEAAAEAERERRAEVEREAVAVRQIDIINQVRLQHREPPLSSQEAQAVRDAVTRRQSSPNVYRNVCWSCLTPVDSASNARCPECGWLACLCGSCRKPTYTDRNGVMAGMCPREAPRHPADIGFNL